MTPSAERVVVGSFYCPALHFLSLFSPINHSLLCPDDEHPHCKWVTVAVVKGIHFNLIKSQFKELRNEIKDCFYPVCVCVGTHRDSSFTGWHSDCVLKPERCVSWCLTKQKRKGGGMKRVFYCKYLSVLSAEVCWMTHPRWVFLSPLRRPSFHLLFLHAQARHPRTNILLCYLGYLPFLFFNSQTLFLL